MQQGFLSFVDSSLGHKIRYGDVDAFDAAGEGAFGLKHRVKSQRSASRHDHGAPTQVEAIKFDNAAKVIPCFERVFIREVRNRAHDPGVDHTFFDHIAEGNRLFRFENQAEAVEPKGKARFRIIGRFALRDCEPELEPRCREGGAEKRAFDSFAKLGRDFRPIPKTDIKDGFSGSHDRAVFGRHRKSVQMRVNRKGRSVRVTFAIGDFRSAGLRGFKPSVQSPTGMERRQNPNKGPNRDQEKKGQTDQMAATKASVREDLGGKGHEASQGKRRRGPKTPLQSMALGRVGKERREEKKEAEGNSPMQRIEKFRSGF